MTHVSVLTFAYAVRAHSEVANRRGWRVDVAVRTPIQPNQARERAGLRVTWSSLLGIALLVTCFERRAHREDAFLASGFGAEFGAYRERTGRMVPRLG